MEKEITVTVEIKILTPMGEYISEPMRLNEEKYRELVDHARTFWQGGYDMWLPNGFVAIPPEIIKKSILIIQIKDYEHQT